MRTPPLPPPPSPPARGEAGGDGSSEEGGGEGRDDEREWVQKSSEKEGWRRIEVLKGAGAQIRGKGGGMGNGKWEGRQCL